MPHDNQPKLQEVVEKYDFRVRQVLNSLPIEDLSELVREIDFQLQKEPHLKLVK